MKKTNKKNEELNKDLDEMIKEYYKTEDENLDLDDAEVMSVLIKDPHTMMVPYEDNVLIISGDFWEANDDFDLPMTLIIDFHTMEKMYAYMKFRQAEINFKQIQF